ncbi:MAG: polysaccharide deacetylase family protein [Alphaproteobacteria bacterium]|nr:polysaccharide deacetylase family protein [Alphaproteobacteria bacterium]
MLARITKAAADPGLAGAWALARFFPKQSVARNIALCRRAGLREPAFVLSFDCDTDADSAVVGSVHARLRSVGLSPLYAVAGEVLTAGAAAYREVAHDGAIFLNHGFRRHAALDATSGDVTSTYFYGATPTVEWQKDIRLGDEAIRDILGQQPNGFRTPHFASFEQPRELQTLWQYLKTLGYSYSSSTRPLFTLRHGPFFHRDGIAEFPVSGCLSQPGQIIDSWGIIRNGDGTPKRLIAELRAYLTVMEAGEPVFLNMYLDPADIADYEEVFSILASFAPYSAPDFATILARANHV